MITYDVDSGGTGDYSEINDSFTGIPGSLADDYTISYRASTGILFSQACLLTARTMNGFKIYIQAAAGHEALISGWDASRARLQLDPGASGSCFVNECNDVEIDGLQISNTRIGDAGSYCYRFQGSATNILVTNTRMSIPDGAPDGYLQETSGSVMFQNFICECLGTQGGGSEGMYLAAAGTLILASGVIKNFNDGVEQDAGTITCIDLAVFNNATDFDLAGTNTVDYCISDDGTGTNAQTISAGGLSEFVDPANGDYTAKEGSNLQFGVGTTNPNVLSTDMEGDARGVATAYIGVDEPGGEVIAEPEDIVQGAPVFGSPTISGNEVGFSYSQITAGFSGFFDLLTDVNERRFNVNAIWTGTITGTDATLKTNASSTPYIVIVDGVDSNPTVAAGEIVLFTGLSDTVHDVQFFSRLAFQGSGNGLNINETEILTVSGASPLIVNLPAEYITDPTFAGQSTESHIATPGGNYTPTWEQSQIHDRERGEVIFNAQIDELWVFTSDLDMWLSIDNGTPSKVVFSVPNEFSSQEQRRLVKISDSLDNSQIHQYTLWYGTRVTYGTQGIVLKNNGALANLESYTDKLVVAFYGNSIVDGSTGATVGEADAYLVGIRNNYAIQKAGKNGRTTSELTTDLPGIIAASFVPDVGVLCIGRNDYSNVAGFEADYSACVDAMVTALIQRIVCRGMTPNDDQDARLITMSSEVSDVVDSKADTDITYMFSDNWIPIETYLNDNTHPVATGYIAQVDDWEAEALRGQIKEPAAPENIIHGAPLFGEPTISGETVPGLKIISTVSDLTTEISTRSII